MCVCPAVCRGQIWWRRGFELSSFSLQPSHQHTAQRDHWREGEGEREGRKEGGGREGGRRGGWEGEGGREREGGREGGGEGERMENFGYFSSKFEGLQTM